jgi:spore germination cell wall hydrolase CwlJ-like protein
MSLRVIPTGMNVIDKAAWKKSFEIAKAVLQKTIPDPTNGATHYLSPVAMKALHYQYPTWSHQFELVAVIENHQFYRAKI